MMSLCVTGHDVPNVCSVYKALCVQVVWQCVQGPLCTGCMAMCTRPCVHVVWQCVQCPLCDSLMTVCTRPAVSTGHMAVCTRPCTKTRGRCWPSNRCRWIQTFRRSSRRSPSCSNVTAHISSSTMVATSRTQTSG